MKCPVCNLINPENAVKCSCGYDFTTHTKVLYRSITYMGGWEFFSNSLRTFGANWTTFIILSAIPTLVSSALALATVDEALHLIATIIEMMVLVLSTMAIMMAAHKTSDGQAINILESYSLSWGLFWRFTWTSILYLLIVSGGLFLLIIPGIIWGIRYVFAPFLVIMEGIGGREALSSSKAITRGRMGGILGREFVFGLLSFLVITIPLALLIMLIEVVLGKPAIGFLQPYNEWAQESWFGYLAVINWFLQPDPEWAQAIRQFGQIISEALFVIFNVILFKSIRALAIDEKDYVKADAVSKENGVSP